MNAGRLTVMLISYLLSVAVAEVARVGQHEEDIFWMGSGDTLHVHMLVC